MAAWPRALIALTVAAALFAARDASAGAAAKLTYVREPGAERCDDEATLRAAVAARVGYDLFFPWAPKTVVVDVARTTPRGYRSTVQIVDEDGLVLGARHLQTSSDDCADLTRALALTISIAVDDRTLEYIPVRKASPPPPAPTSPPVDSAPPPPVDSAPPPPVGTAPPPPPAPPSRPASLVDHSRASSPESPFVAWLTPTVAARVAPAVAAGAEIDASLRYAGLSVAMDARADLPASVALNRGGRVATWLFLVSAVPCVHWPYPLALCAVFGAGRFSESGSGVGSPRTEHALFASAGGRVAAELPIAGRLFLVGHGDVLAALTRHILQVDAQPVFTIPAVSLVVGVGVGAHF
jgi:hypothetical protein